MSNNDYGRIEGEASASPATPEVVLEEVRNQRVIITDTKINENPLVYSRNISMIPENYEVPYDNTDTDITHRTQVYRLTHMGDGTRRKFIDRAYISFSYGGKPIEDFGLIVTYNGSLQKNAYADFSDNVTTSDVWDGQIYWNTHFTNNSLDLTLSTDGMTQRQLDNFRRWFKPGVIRPLVLAEHPNRSIDARISSPPSIDLIPFDEPVTVAVSGGPVTAVKSYTALYKGSISISFVMDEPFWKSRANIVQPAGNTWGGEEWIDPEIQSMKNIEGKNYSPVLNQEKYYNVNLYNEDAFKIIHEDNLPTIDMIPSDAMVSFGTNEALSRDMSYSIYGSRVGYAITAEKDNPDTLNIDESKNGGHTAYWVNSNDNPGITLNPVIIGEEDYAKILSTEPNWDGVITEEWDGFNNFSQEVLKKNPTWIMEGNCKEIYEYIYSKEEEAKLEALQAAWDEAYDTAYYNSIYNSAINNGATPEEAHEIANQVTEEGIQQQIQGDWDTIVTQAKNDAKTAALAAIPEASEDEENNQITFELNDSEKKAAHKVACQKTFKYITEGYFYYGGTAPCRPIITFKITPQFENDYIVIPYNPIHSSPEYRHKTANTFVVECEERQYFKFTTPSVYTGYNQAIRVFKQYQNLQVQGAWEEVRAALRDNVKHWAPRAYALGVIDSEIKEATTTRTNPEALENCIKKMKLFLDNHQGGEGEDESWKKGNWKDGNGQIHEGIADSTLIQINCQTGEVLGTFSYRVMDSYSEIGSKQVSVENIGDMMRSNYLTLEERNYPNEEDGLIQTWTEENKQHSYRFYTDCPMSNVSFQYNYMYY